MRIKTVREACEELAEYQLTEGQLKRGCAAGRYPSMMLGNRVLVDVDALRPILESERQAPQLLSTGELALRVGLSESGIRRGVAEGWLPCRIIGRNMRFDLAEVQKAIQERMTERYKDD